MWPGCGRLATSPTWPLRWGPQPPPVHSRQHRSTPIWWVTRRAVRSRPGGSRLRPHREALVESLHATAPGVLDNQHSLALAQRADDLAGEAEDGGLVRRAVSH